MGPAEILVAKSMRAEPEQTRAWKMKLLSVVLCIQGEHPGLICAVYDSCITRLIGYWCGVISTPTGLWSFAQALLTSRRHSDALMDTSNGKLLSFFSTLQLLFLCSCAFMIMVPHCVSYRNYLKASLQQAFFTLFHYLTCFIL